MTCRLQQLHAQVSVALTEDLQDSCDQASRTITLVQEGIIQHQLLNTTPKCQSLNEELTHCTRAFLCLNTLAGLSDGIGALSVDEESLLVAADTAATNLKGVVEAVQDFSVRVISIRAMVESSICCCRCSAAQNGTQTDSPLDLQAIPMHLHAMVRQVSGDEEPVVEGTVLSVTVGQLLRCAAPCAVATSLVYRAQIQARTGMTSAACT